MKIALIIIGLIVFYAIGFSVTKVDLAETKSPVRQTQLVRIIRALFNPDLITYDKETAEIKAPVKVPCTDESFKIELPDNSDQESPYLILSSNCLNAGDVVTVEGFNFPASDRQYIQFIPPSGVKLNFAEATTDKQGYFITEGKAPKNRDSDEYQYIQVTTTTYAGNPRPSKTLIDTWDKIIETLFLALLSTTAGCLLALPLSFFAAKNLMERVKTNFVSISLVLILIPIGFYIGMRIASIIVAAVEKLSFSSWLLIGSTVLFGLIDYLIIRLLLTNETLSEKLRSNKWLENGIKLIAGIAAIFFLVFLADAMMEIGQKLSLSMGSFGFLGSFIEDLGEILEMIIPLLVAISLAFLFSSWASRIGNFLLKKVPATTTKKLSILLSVSAYALIAVLVMSFLNWLYLFKNPSVYTLYPAIIGGVFGLILSFVYKPEQELKIGNAIYFITRMIFNVLRSIESLVMVIVFVVWVGIGPFAGALALALHTIAALGKMYSEQVENILEGPLEAIQATGANLLQQIVYAVIPQIIPPYISFTLYRWDQNVRTSTVIGFAGGGGIGFLLQQNINLLNYRAASVQMIAIAVVVSLMDYLSGYVRNKIV